MFNLYAILGNKSQIQYLDISIICSAGEGGNEGEAFAIWSLAASICSKNTRGFIIPSAQQPQKQKEV